MHGRLPEQQKRNFGATVGIIGVLVPTWDYFGVSHFENRSPH
jgi:hypothetical protein